MAKVGKTIEIIIRMEQKALIIIKIVIIIRHLPIIITPKITTTKQIEIQL
jgi:hypothetical protein